MSTKDNSNPGSSDYVTLAQLCAIIKYKKLSDMHKHKAIAKVLEKMIDINYKVPSNRFFQFSQPELIGCTALHMALENFDLGVFKQLLEHNVDFCMEDSEGKTVLHKAVEKSYINHKKCWELKGKLEHPFANLVLSAHVQQHNYQMTWNKYGISSFHVACMMNHVEAVRFFIKSGVSVDLDIYSSSPVYPGYTPLHFAARYSSMESAEALIDFGADPFLTDAKGFSPIHILIQRTLEILDCLHVQKQNLCDKFIDELDTNLKMIKLIFNKKSFDADRIGITPLHIACILNDKSMAEEIIPLVTIDNSVYDESPIWPGYTALHFAAHVSMDVVKLLLQYGANIVIKDVYGMTPFDLCMERCSFNDILFLITSNPLWNSITFSDNLTKLSDFISALQDQNTLAKLLSSVDVSMILPISSPLWPGHTILHLTILFCERVNKLDHNLYKTTDYFKINIKECDYLLKLYKNDYKEEEEKSYFQRIKQILNISANLMNLKDAYGSTALHLAFRLQNRSVIKLLLEFNANIDNIVDKDGLSHLHIACAMGNKELVKKLLAEEQKTDINCPMPHNLDFLVTDEYHTQPSVFFSTPGWTPLHLAVVIDHAEIVQMLLKCGANINSTDADDFTPLHRVFQLDDYYDVGIELLSVGKLKKNYSTSFGLNYLHVACLIGSECDVQRLLNLGADIEATYFLPEYPEIYSDQDNLTVRTFLKKYAGYTPLHIAAIEGHLSVICLLIEYGANIFAESPDGTRSLSDLIFSNDPDISERFLSDCVEEDIKVLKKLKDNIGLTKLHRMCFYPDEHEIMRFLIYNDVDVNASIKSYSPVWAGKTALHFLVMHKLQSRKDSSCNSSHTSDSLFLTIFGFDLPKKSVPPRERPADFLHRYIAHNSFQYDYSGLNVELCMNALLTYGADVTLTDANQLTPVHLASELLFLNDENDDEQAMEDENGKVKSDEDKESFPYCLVAGQKDFSINPFDYRGMSHFHVACICNYVDSVEEFLKHGVDVNRPLEYFCERFAGFTPLHLAAYHKSRDSVQILLKYGADVNAQDSLGNTPLHVAADYCHIYSNCLVDEDILQMLIKRGAQIDSENLCGETPLAVFMRSGNMTSRGLEILVRDSHCCVNIFNMETGQGFLAETLPRHSIKTIRSSYLYKAVIQDPVKNNKDLWGRTVIHNIVSTPKSNFTSQLYLPAIERFIKTGLDINHQDERGWTALHMAAHFKNYNGIVALLEHGADINLSNADNKSALELYVERNEENNENRRDIIGIFLLQVHRQYLVDIEISRGNREMVARLSDEFILNESDLDTCETELGLLKASKICSITWFDILSHSKAFLRAIKGSPCEFTNYFGLNPSSVRGKFPAFCGLLLMQYRNVADRNKLVEPAKSFFRNICGFDFPDLCSQYIISFLSNNDLKSLIALNEEM